MILHRHWLLTLVVIALAACRGRAASPHPDAEVADAPNPGIDAPSVPIDAPGADAFQAPVDAFVMPGSGCEGRPYLFCEDFEGDTPGALPAGWELDHGWQEGDPSVTADEHHSGERAFRSAMSTAGQNRARANIESLGDARGTHWGRVFYKVATPFFIGGYVHNTFVALVGANESRVVDTVLGPDRPAEFGHAHQFLLNTPDDQCCMGSSYAHHTYDGAWHCAEWQVVEGTQSFRFYIDGAEVTDLALDGIAYHPIESYSWVTIGLRDYQNPDPPYQAFIDDLAIDETRIGCD